MNELIIYFLLVNGANGSDWRWGLPQGGKRRRRADGGGAGRYRGGTRRAGELRARARRGAWRRTGIACPPLAGLDCYVGSSVR